MFGIGTQEILFIVLIVLLFFGGKKNTGTNERTGKRSTFLQRRNESNRK